MTSKRDIACHMAAIRGDHQRLAAVCQTLEEIADELPHPRALRCVQVVQQLTSLLPEHHATEEALFRSLAHSLGTDAKSAALVERIIAQHHEDEDLAHQITEALERAQRGEEALEPHMLGYLLRCFFSGYRRSMLIEELVLEACLKRTGA